MAVADSGAESTWDAPGRDGVRRGSATAVAGRVAGSSGCDAIAGAASLLHIAAIVPCAACWSTQVVAPVFWINMAETAPVTTTPVVRTPAAFTAPEATEP